MFGVENQRSAMRGNCERRPEADNAHEAEHHEQQQLRVRACAIRDRAFGLQHEPGRAEQRIARRDAERAQERERRREVERAARERAVLDLDALNEPAEDQPLRQRRDGRAAREGRVPVFLAGVGDRAKFERDAAKHKREQHRDDRQVERRHDHRIGARERDQQPTAAEHQPGLVAVPERRDRTDHLVALALRLGEGKQNADAEIEPVENHVERNRDADQRGPGHREIPFHRHGRLPYVVASRAASLADDSGLPSVRPCGASIRLPCGPFAIRRLM